MARVNGGNEELTKQLTERNGGQKSKPTPSQLVGTYLEKIKPQLAQVLPKHVSLDRLSRVALTTIRTNPKLLQCDMGSLMGAVMQAATLGLEPGILGHCYIIPYGREATFVIGYKGMIDLARRSGNIRSISAHEVYENDHFELAYGLDEKLVHIPWHVRTDQTFDEPGDLRGAYMVAHFTDGGHYLHYMSKHEIEQHRKRSKAANNGPWVTDYIEMCKKTVVRSGWKWLPISVEIAEQVVEADESVKHDVTDMDGVIDLPPEPEQEEPVQSEQEEPEPEQAEQTGLRIEDEGIEIDGSKLGF